MKLIFAVLDVSLTMGLTRCYKTEGFLHLWQVVLQQFWIKFTNRFNMIICIGAALRLFVVVINICNLITWWLM